MKKLWLSGIFIASCFITQAQFSVSAKYGINSFPEWETLINESGSDLTDSNFISDGLEYGFSYWFRLKNYRVEFMPEISYQSLDAQNRTWENINFKKESYFFTFNTLVYTLDILGDCNCPTWGKDGSFIQKGFFVGVSPGIGYHSIIEEYWAEEHNESTNTTVKNNKIAFRVGVSTGLDIGITKWITVTPYATLNYTPALTWDNLDSLSVTEQGDIQSQIWQIQPGLRLTFRPDYLKEQRAMFR